MMKSIKKIKNYFKRNRLNPGVFGTKSFWDKILYGFSLFCLFAVCFLQLYLLLWMCYSSLKDDIDMFISLFALPKYNALHWENFSTAIKLIRAELFIEGQGYVSFGLPVLIKNSVILALVLPIQGQIVMTITAFILAKYQFKGRDLLLKINYFVMIFPIVGSLASSLKVNYLLGRFDNLFMMCVTGAHPFGGLGLLIQMSFYAAIPKEMMEAAQVDGASHFQNFFHIHLPIVLPTVFLYYILAVFGAWNDYMTPLVWLPSLPNVALGIYQFQYDAAKYAATLPQVLAAFILMSIPTIIFYLMNQKMIASRLVMTGLKG